MNKTLLLSLAPFILAFLAGAMLPFQAASNAAAGKALGHPLWGAMLSLTVSVIVLILLLYLLRVPAPRIDHVLQGPWWLWAGGVFGALFVYSAAALMPRLGAGGFIVCVVAGQLLFAVMVDHLGLMNLPTKPITLTRIIGVGLLLAGVYLIQYTHRSE